MKMTQEQMFYDATRKTGEANILFLEMVKEGMTKRDLKRLIKIRPSLWQRWENWLEKLPE